MHGASGRQILGQRAPLAAGAQNVHHAVDHLADSDAPFAAAGLARRDQRLDMRPFRIGQVARITQFVAVVARAVCRQSTWGTSRANSPPQRITADSTLQEGPPDNRFIRLIKSPDGHLGLPPSPCPFARPGGCVFFGLNTPLQAVCRHALSRCCSRSESAVEPTRSQNITVSWRRSASAGRRSGAEGATSSVGGSSTDRATMAA